MPDPEATDPMETRPIARAEYERLVELGCFDDERVELLYGQIVRVTPQGPRHDGTIQRLTRLLVSLFGDRAAVRIQSAFVASSGSEPQPDVAIVPPGDYLDAHPDTAHLIVEVARTSLARDRGPKARLYAECGVPEYWVVDVSHALIEVHTDIVDGRYTRVTPYRAGETITLVRFPDLLVEVDRVVTA